jgi:hypothetical protein
MVSRLRKITGIQISVDPLLTAKVVGKAHSTALFAASTSLQTYTDTQIKTNTNAFNATSG